MTFVEVPFTVNPTLVADNAIESLRTAMPGWEPADGNLEVLVIEGLAQMSAETAEVARIVPSAIFGEFGRQIVTVVQIAATTAVITSTWTARDNAGYAAPAGTQVGYRVSLDTLIVFELLTDVVIPTGSTSVGGVQLVAVEPGAASNGVPVGPLELVDSLSWVDTIASTTVSAGGVDAETDEAYNDRLAAQLRLLTPRPILTEDFAVLARNVPGVFRALAINGYNPDDASTSNEKYVCVVPITPAGVAVPTGIKDAVVAYLSAMREVNFVVAAAAPSSTTVNVTYSVRVASGYDASDVTTRVSAVITAWLSPATWAGGDQSPPVWRAGENKVRLLALGAVIVAVAGVAYVATLTINGAGSDLTLSGVAPLPQVGTITGSAV